MKRIGSYWLWIVAVCFLVLFPLCFHSLFYINNMIDILIGALFGVSLNLLIGYTGLLSLGQNAFFGLGSYTMGVLLRQTSLGIPLTLLSLMFLGAVYAVFMGYFCTKLTKFYFAFLTLAFSQIIYIIIIKWTSLTGGQQGLIGGIPVPLIHLLPGLSVDIGPRLHFYYFTVVLVVGSFILCKAVVNSPFGWVLRSIRENATRAQFVGVNIRRYQIGVFVISGIFTAVAGGAHRPQHQRRLSRPCGMDKGRRSDLHDPHRGHEELLRTRRGGGSDGLFEHLPHLSHEVRLLLPWRRHDLHRQLRPHGTSRLSHLPDGRLQMGVG